MRPADGMDPRVRDRLARLGSLERDLSAGQLALLGLAVLPVTVLVAFLPVALMSSIRPPLWIFFRVTAAAGAVPALLTMSLLRRIGSKSLANRYRRATACASCGYDMETLPAELDGCRVCPECGAAWRLGSL